MKCIAMLNRYSFASSGQEKVCIETCLFPFGLSGFDLFYYNALWQLFLFDFVLFFEITYSFYPYIFLFHLFLFLYLFTLSVLYKLWSTTRFHWKYALVLIISLFTLFTRNFHKYEHIFPSQYSCPFFFFFNSGNNFLVLI